MKLGLGMTAKQKNDCKGPQRGRCGHLNMKPPISKVSYLKDGSTVTLDRISVAQVLILHRVAPG